MKIRLEHGLAYVEVILTFRGRSLYRHRSGAAYIPPMTGLATEEPLYARQGFLDSQLGRGRLGEILRNLLTLAYWQGEPGTSSIARSASSSAMRSFLRTIPGP